MVAGGRVVANDTAAALKSRLGSTTIEIGLGSEEDGRRAEALLSRIFSDHTEREGVRCG